MLYGRLMRSDRPIGTWLVLWPALWSLWIAGNGHPDGTIVVIFVAGAFLMRSAGCIINDYADRKIDPHIERTKHRPLATGEVAPREALLLAALLALIAFALVLLLNRLTIALALVAVLLTAIYPFTKRWTHLPQLVLGLAFGWAIPMAFAAVLGEVPPIAWLLLAADICWVMAYDTIYAMVDRDDDLRIGVQSTAILFGSYDRLIIGLFQLTFLSLLLWMGWHHQLGIPALLGLLAAALLCGYQQWGIRKRGRDACLRAFLNNHPVGALIFFGVFIDYAVR
ncbi:MAG: 4-hydroxybenzoate octaprenyltransferase [Mariprofundales bacterium]|nr:4-hydroxybenzoate octaprenyltransferase [Mariprofundales bacterium]